MDPQMDFDLEMVRPKFFKKETALVSVDPMTVGVPWVFLLVLSSCFLFRTLRVIEVPYRPFEVCSMGLIMHDHDEEAGKKVS